MRTARLAWPGIALTITFIDDFVAGPILAATGAWVGGQGGVVLGVVVFTALVAALVGSAVLASREMDPLAVLLARIIHPPRNSHAPP